MERSTDVVRTCVYIDVTRLADMAQAQTGIARIGRELSEQLDSDNRFDVVRLIRPKFLRFNEVEKAICDPGHQLFGYRDQWVIASEDSHGGEVFPSVRMSSSDLYLSTHLPLPGPHLTGDAKRAVIVHDLIHHEQFGREPAVEQPSMISKVLESTDVKRDLVVVPSATTLQDLVSLNGWERANTLLLPWGTHFHEQEPAQARQGVLAVLQASPRKNSKVALEEIVAALGEAHLSQHMLRVVATGSMVEYSQNYLSASPLGDDRWSVRSGVTDRELMQLLGETAVFLYPSSFEGFGLPMIEAFACGAPVVAVIGSASVEVGGPAVCYAASPSLHDLRSAVSLVLSDVDYQQHLSSAGRNRAQTFSWQSAAHRLADALLSL